MTSKAGHFDEVSEANRLNYIVLALMQVALFLLGLALLVKGLESVPLQTFEALWLWLGLMLVLALKQMLEHFKEKEALKNKL